MADVTLGAVYLGERRARFTVWAPKVERLELHLLTPRERLIPMEHGERGYWSVAATDVEPGTRYWYRLEGERDLPDPASRWQPLGVHGPSALVDPGSFAWSDREWRGVPQDALVFYELHVGTFTPEGTFDAVVPRLPDLAELGITAIELMPVSQFPGERNWGYDAVYPFAVQHSYGGPDGLRWLVDACHRQRIAVFLDVVYNHLGPEGNYLGEYGFYFTERYRTPWGPAINFDGPASDEVRRYVIENALMWLREYHIDGFRLDAVHAILDQRPLHILEELSQAIHREAERQGRLVHVIAESDANDPRLIAPPAAGGYGLDGIWSDDFHHSLHTLLTGERQGYYQDYGSLTHLVRALRSGFTYAGQYSAHRHRSHGRPAPLAQPRQFVVCAQNHDQVGNRAAGERLSQLVSFAQLKLAAATVLLSPYLPLLFMGEEYGETAPFQYFTSHSDPELAQAVREGRRREFAAFAWGEEVPDPQDPATFERSKLQHALREQPQGAALREFYRELLRLRRSIPALATLDREELDVSAREEHRSIVVRRQAGESRVCLILCFAEQVQTIPLSLEPGTWLVRLDSEAERWLGQRSGSADRITVHQAEHLVHLNVHPWSAVLLEFAGSA
jgi:maltooligosyltrehalose trehalohydrolase